MVGFQFGDGFKESVLGQGVESKIDCELLQIIGFEFKEFLELHVAFLDSGRNGIHSFAENASD